jgi:hypothetical protein
MNTQFQGSVLSVIQVSITEFCFIKGAASLDIDFRFYESVSVSLVFDFLYSPTMFFVSFMSVMQYIPSRVLTVFCLRNGTLLTFLALLTEPPPFQLRCYSSIH